MKKQYQTPSLHVFIFNEACDNVLKASDGIKENTVSISDLFNSDNIE